MEDILRKAIDTISLHYSRGVVSVDTLIKACDNYKIKSSDFVDDYSYDVYVSKSIFDSLNGIEQDVEICKAIVPGQTKVIDGVTYIYTPTPNAKTDYDWRVLNKKGAGRQVDDDQVGAKQHYVNELFPKDLSSLKVLKKLGGSTGAQLVEDTKGNQYVMKRGGTSNSHVRNEYYANQLYDVLGVRVPDYELYDDNGEAVLLSKFIPQTRIPNASDYDQMAKHFVIDALLANWDIYQNDNCLIDAAGRVIRVDNGGSMSYRAQGGRKNFGYDCVDFESMLKHNKSVLDNLTDEDLIDQIDDVLSKKDTLLNYIELAQSNSNSKAVFEQRIDSLKKRRDELLQKSDVKNAVVVPRDLKSDTEMYRTFTEDELKDFWKNQQGGSYATKLTETNNLGWELLQTICKARGFDARPKVVEDDEYWQTVGSSGLQLFRGLADEHGVTADYCANHFKFSDSCFYGSYGIYGEGIYFHVNDGNNSSRQKTDFKKSSAYRHGLQYSHSDGVVLECVMDPTSKIVNFSAIKKEVSNLVAYDKAAVQVKEDELNIVQAQLTQSQNDLKNVIVNIENDVKSTMHWNENTFVSMDVEVDMVNWGEIDENGDPNYPDYDTFVLGNMSKWVTSNGGTVTPKIAGNDDVLIFKLPNSKESFMLSKYQWENNAIKQKNQFTRAYNYPLRRFTNWITAQHYNVIQKEIDERLSNVGDNITKIQTQITKHTTSATAINLEIEELKKPKNPNGDILSAIAATHGDEKYGVYAAIKGYDAIKVPHGNGTSNSFLVVLNRSKVVVNKIEN